MKRDYFRISLVVQWMRIHLPMQGTRVQFLVRGDSTCPRAIKPICHSYCTQNNQATTTAHRTTKPEHCATEPVLQSREP